MVTYNVSRKKDTQSVLNVIKIACIAIIFYQVTLWSLCYRQYGIVLFWYLLFQFCEFCCFSLKGVVTTRRGLAMKILSVRLSVRPSVCLSVCQTHALWQNGRKIGPDFYIIRKTIQPTFPKRSMVWGGEPFYLKFWVIRPPLKQNRRFWTDNRSYSASVVTPSEKSSINANRKSTTRFPMSLRWSSYVAPKSPKGGLKNAKRPICVKNWTSLEESLLQSFFVWKLSAANL